MLIAPSLPHGLCLHLKGKITSPLYQNDASLRQIGVEAFSDSAFKFTLKITLLKLPMLSSLIGARPRTILVW